jgi:hypothetical protein
MPIFTNVSDGKVARSEFGHVFAQRAKAATVDTFPCPSVAAVQACLLMAYEGFGANQDSALWMYLGLAIRMAVDLGLQKMVGVKYQGEKDPWYTRTWNQKNADAEDEENKRTNADWDTLGPEEQHEVEQERIDTFWAVFILDRVISSGTGRPVTFRDDDFELALPESDPDTVEGWPDPLPTFIRIIHLYGRVSDVLNNIHNANDLTEEKMSKLAQMEGDLTQIYQKQHERLNFSAQNFQEYVKAGQGTTFILLHFWFHALIIVLHQPTLLTPFGSLSRTQLLSNSRELSMSSAKTISDILAFAELIDPKSYIGNPFTSQPMYIAACAFLMESASKDLSVDHPSIRVTDTSSGKTTSAGPRSGKHSILTSTANQNYQRCYQALQNLHDYWGGVKYILTALDQKSKGIWDCETYTNEEYESTKPPRRTSLGRFARIENPASPNIVPMAFSLTGTTNSPNPSLTLLYQNNVSAQPPVPPPPQHAPVSAATPPGNMRYDPIRQSLPELAAVPSSGYPQPNVSAVRYTSYASSRARRSTTSSSSVASPHTLGKSQIYETPPTPDEINDNMAPESSKGPMLGGGMSQQQGPSPLPPPPPPSYTSSGNIYDSSSMVHGGGSPGSTLNDSAVGHHHASHHHQQHHSVHHQQNQQQHGYSNGSGSYNHDNTTTDFSQNGLAAGAYSYLGHVGISDVITLDSQEIDLNQFNITHDVPSAWLQYLPDNVLELFEAGILSDNGGNGGTGQASGGGG